MLYFSILKILKLCVLGKSQLSQAASVAATGRLAKLHGTRSGASREVCARDSSLAEGDTPSRAGNDAKGVRAKFRYGVARSDHRAILNFDLTPFASNQDLPTTNHTAPHLFTTCFHALTAGDKSHRAKKNRLRKREAVFLGCAALTVAAALLLQRATACRADHAWSLPAPRARCR